MFHKILVAIDTSALTKDVFDKALFLAKASEASLMLLHVLSGEEQGRPNIPVLPRQDYYPYPVMSKNPGVQSTAVGGFGKARSRATAIVYG